MWSQNRLVVIQTFVKNILIATGWNPSHKIGTPKLFRKICINKHGSFTLRFWEMQPHFRFSLRKLKTNLKLVSSSSWQNNKLTNDILIEIIVLINCKWFSYGNRRLINYDGTTNRLRAAGEFVFSKDFHAAYLVFDLAIKHKYWWLIKVTRCGGCLIILHAHKTRLNSLQATSHFPSNSLGC